MPNTPSTNAVQDLLDRYNLYDEHVDVVSAMEWLFTGTKEIPNSIQHFERYPRIKVSDTVTLTPDFTVLYSDGTALIGEIAQFATHEESVDDLCHQLGNYDGITQVPGPDGALVTVTRADVLLIVPSRLGQQAVRRIIDERMQNPEHEYKPQSTPTIAQYSRDSERYTFQRLAHAQNGSIPATQTPMTLGFLLENDLSPRVSRFKDIKSDRRFMNDPINDLYLATHLWTATWPTLHPGQTEDITVDVADLAAVLRAQFGKGSTKDIRKALRLLQKAGLAAVNKDGSWTVSRKKLSQRGEHDVSKIIATRAVKKPKPRVEPRNAATPVQYTQDSLF